MTSGSAPLRGCSWVEWNAKRAKRPDPGNGERETGNGKRRVSVNFAQARAAGKRRTDVRRARLIPRHAPVLHHYGVTEFSLRRLWYSVLRDRMHDALGVTLCELTSLVRRLPAPRSPASGRAPLTRRSAPPVPAPRLRTVLHGLDPPVGVCQRHDIRHDHGPPRDGAAPPLPERRGVLSADVGRAPHHALAGGARVRRPDADAAPLPLLGRGGAPRQRHARRQRGGVQIRHPRDCQGPRGSEGRRLAREPACPTSISSHPLPAWSASHRLGSRAEPPLFRLAQAGWVAFEPDSRLVLNFSSYFGDNFGGAGAPPAGSAQLPAEVTLVYLESYEHMARRAANRSLRTACPACGCGGVQEL